ncbi:MAG: hypothetical protein RL318_989 [Fibrobacterota bacterium]
MKNKTLAALGAALLLGVSGCGLQPIPQPESSNAAGASASGVLTAKTVGVRDGAYPAFTFFDEDYQQGGFSFVYGGSTKLAQQEGQGAFGSEYFLHFSIDQKDYSGAAVCLWNQSFDLSPYMKSGAVVFQARGLNGNEKIKIGLVDDEKSDGWKSVARVDLLPKYGMIKKGEWTTFVVPLRDFGKRGVAWDAAKGIEVGMAMQWDLIQEFRIITNKGDNPECEIDIDNFQIWADAIDPAAMPASEDWQDIDKSTDAPTPEQMKLNDEIVGSFFVEDLAAFAYTYGGTKTTYKPLESTTPGNQQALATYMENDYSGVSISIGNDKFMDLTPYRKTGTLSFWVKGGKASTKFMVGLIDRQGADIKVQTKVQANDYVEGLIEEGKWIQVRVPLKKLIDDGTYWDADKGREISKKVDWSKIQEVRFSIARDENKPGVGKPVSFIFDQIQITKTAIGMRDDDAFWNVFKSDAKDVLLFDFDGKTNEAWQAAHGTTAFIARSFVPAGGKMKGKALKIDFKPGDWFDVLYQMGPDKAIEKDWTKHWGLSLWIYTEKPYQQVDVVVQDRDHEMFLATTGSVKGWNQVIVPFRSFSKYPYYQPPEAKQNNKFDLDGVFQISFKPSGEVPGSMMIKNIGITNQREVTKVKGAAVEPAEFKGDLGKVVKNIGDIYGINIGLWAPELMEPATVELTKPIKFGTIRYPGGLRSDEDHWEDVLKAKDFHIDTDEFLEWIQKVHGEPMFTANVGCGTPEENARWVEHVNKKRKGPKVKYWEIGNEIYGNWHKYYDVWGKDGGEAYGKAARQHILAMKKVDPTIKITVVWQLTGEWNKNVLKHVADVVDGVNVHHYAQKAGTDNDQALLAVSDEADKVIEDVREQVEKHGVKGKHYEIWLTEWNSVDFNPGAQILQHVNGVFVADYLGHIAQSSLDKANLWALINGRDKRMGDYGILASSADPQGMNAKRPTYWALKMASNTLEGQLLKAATDKEDLSGWVAKKPNGKLGFLFVNKNLDSDYKTKLKLPGLKGKATIEILTKETSGGLKGSEPTGEVYPSTGPVKQEITVADGSEIVIPKASVVTINVE